jgi:hypothetical protein
MESQARCFEIVASPPPLSIYSDAVPVLRVLSLYSAFFLFYVFVISAVKSILNKKREYILGLSMGRVRSDLDRVILFYYYFRSNLSLIRLNSDQKILIHIRPNGS